MSGSSEWKIGCQTCGVRTLYQVYRLIDSEGEDWKGNRETRGGLYDSLIDAEKLCRKLNEEEARTCA